MEPFHLIVEELWDLVLEKLDDPDDILNLFYTYPNLIPFLYKKFVPACLMPLLFPKYLDFNDARNCRLVSKRWKDAVDNTLVSHSDRKPYEPIEASGLHRRMTLKSPFSYQALPNFVTSRSVVSSQETRNEIMLFPVDANPFIGRSFSIHMESRNRAWTAAHELRQMLPILERFGGHIHYAHFHFSQDSCRFGLHNIIKALLDCLTHLPNLKTLKLSGFMVHSYEEEDLNSLKQIWGLYDTPSSHRIPAHLETLDIAQFQNLGRHVMHKLVTSLISHDRLQKLVMRELNWDYRLAPLCHHLRELNLKRNIDDDWLGGTGDLLQLRMLLVELDDATNLMKVSLTCETIKFPRLASMLRRRPWIQAVEISILNKSRQSKIKDDPIQLSSWSDYIAPSVRQIIFDRNVGFTITHLTMTPNLEYLGVRIIETMPPDATSLLTINCNRFIKKLIKDNAPVPMVSNKLYYYFHAPNDPNFPIERPIWDVLPRLKMFTILDNKGVIVRRYVRECKNEVFKC